MVTAALWRVPGEAQRLREVSPTQTQRVVNTRQETERADESYMDQRLFTAVRCFSGRQGSLAIGLRPA